MTHPYKGLPDYAYWRRAVEGVPVSVFDPVINPRIRISKHDRVATAGSCFAQHIARHLTKNGFNYYVTETAHPFCPEDIAASHNYGVFTARYANIYTSRQLVQLFTRAYGTFQPLEDVWQRADGRFVDPFRPQISPSGYATTAEMLFDRTHHLACVRQAFETLDVFVFTLGLTEGWCSKEDGAVFPVCPGVSGGSFDDGRHRFFNLRVADVTADLREFRTMLHSVNPNARILLTTSPVPLVATAEDRHVLVSTTASKAVLRAACDEMLDFPDVDYFPSYEIITGAYNRGTYFANDLRSVTESGVSHVMRLFLQHMALDSDVPTVPGSTASPVRSVVEEMAEIVRVVCEEEALNTE